MSPAAATPRSALRLHLLALAAWAAAIFAVFSTGFAWSEVGFFHRFFDQVSYRYDAAHVAEAIAQHGLISGFVTAWEKASAQGFAYPLVGGISYWAGCDPAHGMFVLFLAGAGVVWWAISESGRAPWSGWLALAVLTSANSLLNPLGSALDFRPDFLGQTLWTAAAACALRSRGFAERGWSVATGVVLGVAFCSRSLTLAYASAALPLCALAAWQGMPSGAPGRRTRLRNLAVAAGLAAAVAAPFFVAHHDAMWRYYVDNHISAKENEARGYRHDFTRYLREYFARSLLEKHVGWAALALMSASAWLTARGVPARELRRCWPLLAVWLAFLTPVVVLAAAPQFNDTVAGIAAGAFTLLGLLPALAFPGRLRPTPLLVLVLALGLALWPGRFLYRCWRDHARRTTAGHHLVALQHAAILQHTAGRREVVLTTLPLIEAHSLAMLEVVGYESTGRLPRRFASGLGHEIYGSPEPEFAARLRASDVVLWWDGTSSGGDLPANRDAAARRALIAEVLAHGFVRAAAPAGEIRLEGHPLRLYFRQP